MNVTIHTKTENGQSTYLLHAGAFSNQNNARTLQEQLSKQTPVPVRISYIESKKLYLVTLGPLTEYKQAIELRDQLSEEDSPQSAIQPVQLASSKPTFEVPSHAPPLKKKAYKKLWNLKNADIRAVIAEVSRVTGKNFLIDPRVQGKISIVSSTPISDKELYQVFLSMLQVSGYAAIPSGSTIKIVPNIDAKTQSPDFLNQLRHPPDGDEMLISVVPVEYVPAEQLVPVLRPLMPQWSSVSAYGPSNMLILSGRASNIRSMADIIKRVDSSSSNGIDIVQLQNALAMDVANTLKDIVKTRTLAGNNPKTMIAPDDRSNSILISGSKTERIRLRLLINQLDQQNSGSRQGNTKVVYLHYLRAEDVVPILAGVAQANFSGKVGTTIGTITKPELDSTMPQSGLATGTSSSPPPFDGAFQPSGSPMGGMEGSKSNNQQVSSESEGSTKPTVQIIGEPNTNSIIMNAPASIISILNSVIRQIDIRPAQILIEAMVAEMNEADVNRLGIEWGTNQQTGNPANFRPGFAIINSKTSISDFQAQIIALANNRRANILSTPSVVVLDNRQAKILVGKQVSVQTTSYPNNASGTTTASPYVTFDRVNVALHLYVRPQITRGNGIQMQIDQGNDTIDPGSTDALNPVFNISSIVTAIHIESGDIVVLGGLIQDSLGNDDQKLPILGDIPGVGRLFQRNIRSREKKMLMVFIKPIILHSEHDAVRVSGGKYQEVRNEELENLRSQEIYIEDDKHLVLEPLSSAKLPIPFSAQTKIVAIAPAKTILPPPNMKATQPPPDKTTK
jgi:general secretion pathway protein D